MTVLLATDFDGTVAPIVSRPDDAVLHPGAEILLTDAMRRGLTLAFVSGRDVADLSRRTSRFVAWRVGSHGREIAAPDGATIREASPLTSKPPEAWLRRAQEAGLLLEWKRHSLAVHWRTSPFVDSEDHPLVGELRAWGDQQGLSTTSGRQVMEVGTPSPGKLDAIELVMAMTGASGLIYAGDDLTDFPAIERAAERGRGYFVTSRERSTAPRGCVTVESIDRLVEVLTREIELLPL